MRFHHGMYFLSSEHLVPLARAIDGFGYSGTCVSDHLFYPKQLTSRYTYSPNEDGSPVWPAETEFPDPWCSISAMAAVTENLHFTTGVYVAPARDLITVAKVASTAAVLSGGRVHLGVGAGWCREEFDATGQPFDGRGARLDDMISALRALWQGGWVEYHGSHYEVPTLQMNPAPRRTLPIYGGGYSAGAVRRAAELCDGWMCASTHSVDEAQHHVGRAKEALRRAGRDVDDFRIYLGLPTVPDVDEYRRFADMGVTDFVVAPLHAYQMAEGRSGDALLGAGIAAAERFATEVIDKVR